MGVNLEGVVLFQVSFDPVVIVGWAGGLSFQQQRLETDGMERLDTVCKDPLCLSCTSRVPGLVVYAVSFVSALLIQDFFPALYLSFCLVSALQTQIFCLLLGSHLCSSLPVTSPLTFPLVVLSFLTSSRSASHLQPFL